MKRDTATGFLWPLLVLVLFIPRVQAAQVQHVEVRRAGANIVIRMRLRIEAAPPAVFAALQDYSALPRFEPAVRAVRIEPTAGRSRLRIFMTLHGCVLFFCKTLHQEQLVTAKAASNGGVVRAEIVPRAGDSSRGQARWTVKPCPRTPSSSCMDIMIDMAPSFWVPPWIGPWLIERKMRRAAGRAGVALEQIARQWSAGHEATPGLPAHGTGLLIR